MTAPMEAKRTARAVNTRPKRTTNPPMKSMGPRMSVRVILYKKMTEIIRLPIKPLKKPDLMPLNIFPGVNSPAIQPPIREDMI